MEGIGVLYETTRKVTFSGESMCYGFSDNAMKRGPG